MKGHDRYLIHVLFPSNSFNIVLACLVCIIDLRRIDGARNVRQTDHFPDCRTSTFVLPHKVTLSRCSESNRVCNIDAPLGSKSHNPKVYFNLHSSAWLPSVD
ncbi:hypothetical protein DL98DRAFT_259476 [Cadophora sp. DSE1049]|nr:hypothetical protein DL98DRAFT_259476 [Cadophora sp. DSE1049]